MWLIVNSFSTEFVLSKIFLKLREKKLISFSNDDKDEFIKNGISLASKYGAAVGILG